MLPPPPPHRQETMQLWLRRMPNCQDGADHRSAKPPSRSRAWGGRQPTTQRTRADTTRINDAANGEPKSQSRRRISSTLWNDANSRAETTPDGNYHIICNGLLPPPPSPIRLTPRIAPPIPRQNPSNLTSHAATSKQTLDGVEKLERTNCRCVRGSSPIAAGDGWSRGILRWHGSLPRWRR